MAFDNPLDSVLRTYRIIRGGLKITRRASDAGELVESTRFPSLSVEEMRRELSQADYVLDDLVVLNLWAAFERYLFDYLIEKAKSISSLKPAILGGSLSSRVCDEVERWKSDDVMDLFKGLVDSNLLGLAKQIKKYRDWGAHRNPKRIPPAKTEPATTYRVLTEILTAIDKSEMKSGA